MTINFAKRNTSGSPRGLRQSLYILAMLAVTLVLLLVLVLTSGLKNGKRTDGLYYAATGIHPDAQLLRIGDQIITAEEYLYWLAYDCEYLSANAGQIDFSAQVTDDMTYGEYVKSDALETVKLYAIIRQWAEEAGIELTQEDLDSLAAEREQYVAYYGSEEAYLQQVQILGVSEEAFDSINSVYYLYARVFKEYTEGSLRPSDEELLAYGQDNKFYTAHLLSFSTEGMDETALATQRATAEGYAQQLQAAEDPAAKYLELAQQLNLDVDATGQTFTAAQADAALAEALEGLQEGQVSGVIESENGFYVALRLPLDLTSLAQGQFDDRLALARADAQIQYNDRLYNSIDAGTFYEKLIQCRTELADSFSQTDSSGDDSTPSSDGDAAPSSGSAETE